MRDGGSPPITIDELSAELQRVSALLDGIDPSWGGTFWMDMVAVELRSFPPGDLRKLAQQTYHPLQKVTVHDVATMRAKSWRKKLYTSMSRMAGFSPSSRLDAGRKAYGQREADWLLDLIEGALGGVRIAGIVQLTAASWYAAIWEDWLLAGPEHAIVLSLQNDS